MATKTIKLKRLARGARSFTRTRLYQAEDHLLLVEGYYVEEYRRFFYRDLQAALWTPHRLRTCVVVGWVVLLSGTALSFFFGGEDWQLGVGVFLSIPAIFLLLHMVYVFAGGGYCKFHLCTAAQQTLIPGVNTCRQARKIVKALEEHVPDAV